MVDAISALVAEVRFDSGSATMASSRTDFIKSISSGWKTAPLGFTFAYSEKSKARPRSFKSGRFEEAIGWAAAKRSFFRVPEFGCNAEFFPLREERQGRIGERLDRRSGERVWNNREVDA